MLPKVNRLTKESDFKKIAKQAKPVHSKFLILKKLKSPEEKTKFGIVISAKISKKAVVRNKIRRQIREALLSNLKNIKSADLVMLVVKSTVIGKSYQEIKEDLENLLKKAGLIANTR